MVTDRYIHLERDLNCLFYPGRTTILFQDQISRSIPQKYHRYLNPSPRIQFVEWIGYIYRYQQNISLLHSYHSKKNDPVNLNIELVNTNFVFAVYDLQLIIHRIYSILQLQYFIFSALSLPISSYFPIRDSR